MLRRCQLSYYFVYLGFLVCRKACFVQGMHFPATGAQTRCEQREVYCSLWRIDPLPSTVLVPMAVPKVLAAFVCLIFWSHFCSPASGQAVISGVFPSPPRYVPSVFIEHRVQHSHCSSTFIECCLLTLSRFPRVNLCTRKSPYEFIRVCSRGDSNSRN